MNVELERLPHRSTPLSFGFSGAGFDLKRGDSIM
jgi:hypothetical protein